MTIVSLVSAMLLPALREAKERANTVVCMSNLNQVGIAIHTYGSDHGVYPQCHPAAGPVSTNNGPWYVMIRSQLANRNISQIASQPGWTNLSPVLRCPSATLKPPYVVNTYSGHKRVLLVPTAANGLRLYPMLERPGEIVMMADGIQNDASNGLDADNLGDGLGGTALPVWIAYDSATAGNLLNPPYDSDGSWLNAGHVRWRHRGRANFLFVDGHVESVKLDQFCEKHIKFTGPIP